MGSSTQIFNQETCIRLSLPLLLWLLPLPSLPPPTLLSPMMKPLSPSPTSMELLMTTVEPTSRRLRARMTMETLLDPTPLLSLMAESRPPPTMLSTTLDLLLRSPMREPLSTPKPSPLLLTLPLLPMLPLSVPTLPLLPMPSTPLLLPMLSVPLSLPTLPPLSTLLPLSVLTLPSLLAVKKRERKEPLKLHRQETGSLSLYSLIIYLFILKAINIKF